MGLLSTRLCFPKVTWVRDEAPSLVCGDRDRLSFSALPLHWDVQGITTSRILSKIPIWSFLGFRSWQAGAGSGIGLRCIDRMQKGTSRESGLADCVTAAKHCYFLKIHVTAFFFFLRLCHLSKKHSTLMKADFISSKHLWGYCNSNGPKNWLI